MRNPRHEKPIAVDVLAAASLYVFEASVVLLALGLYRLGDRSLLASLGSRPGTLCVLALTMLVVSSILFVRRYRTSRLAGRVPFRLAVATNLVTLIVVLATAELAVRFMSLETPQGLVFLETPLRPRDWREEAARNQKILKKASLDGSYLVYDDLLGWTIGPNRRSANGLYFSSVEGIRSPRTAMAFAEIPATYRIALVGNSFTFSEDVPYEESWGHHLDRELGPEFQVLNFGVGGYGLDQAYLRYTRNVRSWRPDFVIFGVFSHDLERTMTVYPFIAFPDWEFPFAKPRFVTAGDGVVALNIPPLSPEAIFERRSIRDLPFIEYDKGYREEDWEWRYYHHSQLLRLLISRFPPWRWPDEHVSDDALMSINSGLLRDFVRVANRAGSIPIVVYLPARRDLMAFAGDTKEETSLGRLVLARAGIDYTDLTPTLMDIRPADRFVVGARHYSPQANAAIAKRLRQVILDRAAGMNGSKGTSQTMRDDGLIYDAGSPGDFAREQPPRARKPS